MVMKNTLLNQRYRLDEELGRGSMGTVYRGYDKLLEREVLVKLLNESRLDEVGKERLLREARAMAKLDHPNIILVYDAGEVNGVPYIVMQYSLGRTCTRLDTWNFPRRLRSSCRCAALWSTPTARASSTAMSSPRM